jgi:hypothetical protein
MVTKKGSWIPTYLAREAQNVSEIRAKASKERHEESNNSHDASNEALKCDQYPSHRAILCSELEEARLIAGRNCFYCAR